MSKSKASKYTSSKAKPQLIIGLYDNVLANFENNKDKKDIHELLQREGILEVLPLSQ